MSADGVRGIASNAGGTRESNVTGCDPGTNIAAIADGITLSDAVRCADTVGYSHPDDATDRDGIVCAKQQRVRLGSDFH